MFELNNIYHMDCLDGMRKMTNRSVDVSFTSPPYNDNGKQDGSSHKKYLHVEQYEDWFKWQVEIIDEMLRVTKKYVIYNIQPIKNNKSDVFRLIGHYHDKIWNILVWNKKNAQPCGNPNKISNFYEFIIVFSNTNELSVNSMFYKNVLTFDLNRDNDYSKIHNAVMNKELCDEIISEFTKENDIVLDPFSGMGTTALSCQEQGRRYIGFEISKVYYKKSIERLNGINNIGQTSIFTDFDKI